jgi:peptide/nickel transport system permease protein
MIRLAAMLPMLFFISLLTFLLFELVPGDPARATLGPDASQAAVNALRDEMGLNDPLPIRFGRWVTNVASGDLGNSLETRQPVIKTIARRLPVTVVLATAAIVVAILLGVMGGMIAGYRIGSKPDRAMNLTAGAILSVPDFWVGLLLITAVLRLQLLPTQGYVSFGRDPVDWALHLILPVLTLALHPTAEIFRQTRASVADVMKLDFVRTLRAGGISPAHALFIHIGRNAMIPVLTVLGLQLGRLLGQTAIVETIFGINGLGSLVVQAGLNSDVVTVQAVVLITGGFVLAINLLIDVAYLFLNPRLRAA